MDLKILNETPPWDWPEEANKLLLKILTKDHDDASERRLAIKLAGDYNVINDKLVDALLTILQSNDEAEQIRCKAATSLGPALEEADTYGFKYPDSIPISEATFKKIQILFRKLYMDAALPKMVRRRILEASVRAPQQWHQDVIRAAYASDDEDWRLTGVFSMRWIRGFDSQILEALESNNEAIHCQAIYAAGNWEMDATWSHISGLLREPGTSKPLMLAAMDAMAGIRPQEAGMFLVPLSHSDDAEIAEAANEAMALAAVRMGDQFDDV